MCIAVAYALSLEGYMVRGTLALAGAAARMCELSLSQVEQTFALYHKFADNFPVPLNSVLHKYIGLFEAVSLRMCTCSRTIVESIRNLDRHHRLEQW